MPLLWSASAANFASFVWCGRRPSCACGRRAILCLYMVRRKKGVLMARQMKSFRLSPEAIKLMEAVSKERGISQSAVIEQAVRDFAEKTLKKSA